MRVKKHQELEVYKLAFSSAMKIFRITRDFPKEERYSLIDQIRRSSRSVTANIAEGFRKRRYPKSFISRLSDSEAEAAETQVWIEFSKECEYINESQYNELIREYDSILGMLVKMMNKAEEWQFG